MKVDGRRDEHRRHRVGGAEHDKVGHSDRAEHQRDEVFDDDDAPGPDGEARAAGESPDPGVREEHRETDPGGEAHRELGRFDPFLDVTG